MVRLCAALVCTCFLLSACGNQGAPTSVPWGNGRIEISANVLTRPLDAEFRLFINGQKVIDGQTRLGEGTHQNFRGVWQGQRVLARYSRQQFVFSSASRVDVFINGNLVETLRL